MKPKQHLSEAQARILAAKLPPCDYACTGNHASVWAKYGKGMRIERVFGKRYIQEERRWEWYYIPEMSGETVKEHIPL